MFVTIAVLFVAALLIGDQIYYADFKEMRVPLYLWLAWAVAIAALSWLACVGVIFAP